MKKLFLLPTVLALFVSCEENVKSEETGGNNNETQDIVTRNIERAIAITDAAAEAYLSAEP